MCRLNSGKTDSAGGEAKDRVPVNVVTCHIVGGMKGGGARRKGGREMRRITVHVVYVIPAPLRIPPSGSYDSTRHRYHLCLVPLSLVRNYETPSPSITSFAVECTTPVQIDIHLWTPHFRLGASVRRVGFR